jgi:predicted lipoprotein
MNVTARRPRIKAWIPITVALLLVAGVGLATTTYVSAADVEAKASEGAFDPVTYADEHFDSEIVPQIEEDAVDLATLLADLEAGAEESEYGHTPGAGSSYSFPVTFTGVAGALNGSILPVAVDGVPDGVTVQLQVGPAITGTALRDVTGTVSFNDFTNQLEFQEVSTEFNTRVRDGALAEAGPISEGQTVTVTGAYTRVNPALVSVVPVKVEVDG